jgi:hypothetical protein
LTRGLFKNIPYADCLLLVSLLGLILVPITVPGLRRQVSVLVGWLGKSISACRMMINHEKTDFNYFLLSTDLMLSKPSALVFVQALVPSKVNAKNPKECEDF